MRYVLRVFNLGAIIFMIACTGGSNRSATMKNDLKKGKSSKVGILMLDPGHFHAALVQKSMYPDVCDTVHVYAPAGPEVQLYLDMVNGFNSRSNDPTHWIEKVYTGNDYLEKMLDERAGDLVVIAGNNKRKTEYILRSVKAGLNVLGDKPMVISPESFSLLKDAFKTAEEKGVLLYDIMTERYEITTILQKELSHVSGIFGELKKGSPDDPAIVQESIHRFSKLVAGKPLIRPAWFFDVSQQGEGIVDISTHLVDLVQWEAFPEKIINIDDIEIGKAKHWTTDLNLEQFMKVTGLTDFPGYLHKYIDDGLLKVYSNGEIVYKIKDVWAKVSVIWNYDEPKGGDTHYSLMRGTKCDLVIRQGAEQQFKPVLYIEPNANENITDFEMRLKEAVEKVINAKYPGVILEKESDRLFYFEIPQKYKVGHEAHFRQVTDKFLKYMKEGKMPEWEIPNMITKYYITTTALKIARENGQ